MNIRKFTTDKPISNQSLLSVWLLDLNKKSVWTLQKKHLKIQVGVFICLCFIVFTSCIPRENDVFIPTSQPTPDYIIALSPKPSEIISRTLYMSGESQTVGLPGLNLDGQPSVCVQYNLTSLGSFSISYITLLIDELATSPIAGVIEESRISRCGTGFGTCRDRNLCWGAPFSIGIHEVIFQLHFKSGEVEDYIWYYEIVEPVTSPTP